MPGKSMQNLPNSLLPSSRVIAQGESSLSDAELLAIVLNTGGKNINALELATELLTNNKSLRNVFDLDLHQLSQIKYINTKKAIKIKAVNEIAKRIFTYDKELLNKKITSANIAYEVIKKYIFNLKKEKLFLISLDIKKRIISIDLITEGALYETLVPIRDICRMALLKNAVHMILVHNHPSNDPTPSVEDIKITQNVSDAAKLLELIFLDHIIACDNSFISIKSLNIFDTSRKEVNK